MRAWLAMALMLAVAPAAAQNSSRVRTVQVELSSFDFDPGAIRLRAAPAYAHVELDMPEGTDEFVLLLARREGAGLAILGPVADDKLVDRAIRKSA